MATPSDKTSAIENAYSKNTDEIAKLLDVNLQTGLNQSSINDRITKYGLNKYE